jgi:alpha-D-xyloside xylohydrolase
LRFPLERGEQIFGLGLNFQTVHQRGKILTLRMDHYGRSDNGRSHAPVPFYVSSRGYGVLINSAEYITVYVGTGNRRDSKDPPEVKDRNTDRTWAARPYSDVVEILVPARGVEVLLFAGPTTLDAVRRYNLYCGGGCLPPRWGLGFTQRVHRLYTADQVMEEAGEFEKRGFPLDFIGLEPGWQSRAYPCTFEWDKGRFPDPAGFVQALKEKGVRVNLWTNPYVSPESPIFKAIEPYTGSHTVWCGLVPDFNIPKAKEILAAQLKKDQVDIGVSGYKIDEVDGGDHYLWPDAATFPSGINAMKTRQTYGILTMKLTDELYRQRNERTFGLVRGTNAGGNNLPYVIYNDYYSHPDFITALINSSFCGVLWTPEVRSSRTGEEWLRRFQSNIFSPMAMINAWSSGTKPWSFPEVTEQVKYFANLRMQLMPYFYTEFAKYHFEGTPPFRAMALEEGFRIDNTAELRNQSLDDNPYLEAVNRECKDQYMAGEYMLVAPVFTGETSRRVILPEGKWYDFYTGEFAGEGQVITVTPGLDKIPVYVKDGGIIPMTETRLHAPAKGEKINIEVRHYGEKPGRYLLYDDDGETFDYEKGDYSWREITVAKNRRGQWEGAVAKAGKGKPDNVGKVTFVFMTK